MIGAGIFSIFGTIFEIENPKDYALPAAAKPFLGLIGFKIMALAALFSTSSAINAPFTAVIPLDGICMLPIASLLIIYVTVNASNLRLLKETGEILDNLDFLSI
jgi:hypothetical protein